MISETVEIKGKFETIEVGGGAIELQPDTGRALVNGLYIKPFSPDDIVRELEVEYCRVCPSGDDDDDKKCQMILGANGKPKVCLLIFFLLLWFSFIYHMKMT